MKYCLSKTITLFRILITMSMLVHVSFLTMPRCGAVMTSFQRSILDAMSHHSDTVKGSHNSAKHHQTHNSEKRNSRSVKGEDTCECFVAKFSNILINTESNEVDIGYSLQLLFILILFNYERWSPEPLLELDPPYPKLYS